MIATKAIRREPKSRVGDLSLPMNNLPARWPVPACEFVEKAVLCRSASSLALSPNMLWRSSSDANPKTTTPQTGLPARHVSVRRGSPTTDGYGDDADVNTECEHRGARH